MQGFSYYLFVKSHMSWYKFYWSWLRWLPISKSGFGIGQLIKVRFTELVLRYRLSSNAKFWAIR